MLKTRVIPCLLLQDLGLVKTVKFDDPKYVGDPINAVKIFNEKEVDELIFLDITATAEKRKPPFELLLRIASECFMPFSYGGGIRDIEDIRKILEMGAEKVSLNNYALENPSFIKEAVDQFGSQSIVVAIDVKKNNRGQYEVFSQNGKKGWEKDPLQWAIEVEELGAGEILLNSIDKDGTMEGYDLELIEKVSKALSIPVIVLGGAGKLEDFGRAKKVGASALAAGSLFVFVGPYRAVLINYPNQEELEKILT